MAVSGARIGGRTVDPATAFAEAVIAAGVVLVAGMVDAGAMAPLAHFGAGGIVFTALVVLSELVTVRLPSGKNDVLLSASSVFAYATAMRYGAGPAVVALMLATLLKGLRDRRAPIKTGFNVAQHGICVGLAGLLFQALGGRLGLIGAVDVLPALAGAAVYLAVNYLLTGIVVALATGAKVRTELAQGLAVWLPIEGVMLSFAPIVPVVAARSLWLLPLLLVPFLGVLYSSRIAVQAEHAALHDALTGLPNRVLFRTRVEQALTRARQATETVLVLVLDLDGFKEVNDTLGHGRGDELLQALSDRLRGSLRDADVIARLGGDEFAILLSGPRTATGLPERLAERIHEVLEQPFSLGDLWVTAGASIGIAIAPDHGWDAERLIQRADVAMYQAKTGATGHERYDADRDPHRPDNLRLAQELRDGLDRDELILHYQPIVALETGMITSVEALARWQHPTRGLLMPSHFIELAERTELVRSLTLQVVRQAARDCSAWRSEGIEVPVAVNLSPRVLLDVALAADIAAVLREEGLPPTMLAVEITESCLVVDPDRTAEVLARLAATGIQIAVDDFGTGYSSLALLKRLPVDAIKIDRSFVTNLCSDAGDAVIVESTVGLGRGLGLTVIAEGVETAAAMRLLAEYGCPQAQGYAICRPQPPELILGRLRAEGILTSRGFPDRP